MSPRRIVQAALLWSAAWSATLQAAVLQLAPIPIEVQAPDRAGVLTLGNRASAEATVQVRAFRWTQQGGEDRLEPTQEIAVSPPLAVVPAGQSLTVRVVRLAAAPPQAEEAFRIWVDELPVGREGRPPDSTLRIVMRYSLPVFFEPAGAEAAGPALSWQLARTAKGRWRLRAANAGARRARFFGLQVVAPDGQAALPRGRELAGYVLAGRSMRWSLKPPKGFPVADGAYRLSYRIGSESRSETLALVREK